MGIQVDWQITEDDGDGQIRHKPRQPLSPWWRRGIITILVFFILIAGWVWWRLYSVEVALRDDIQAVLDFEHEAFLAGDGELFFSVYEDDLTFQSAQLHPQQQAPHAAGWRVMDAELQNKVIWANLSAEVDAVSQQRIAFFEQTQYGLVHLASDPAYWGEEQSLSQAWGTLRFSQADAPWAEQMTSRIGMALQNAQLEQILPFSVVIRPDFQVSLAPNQVTYPSPQLVGLDMNGQPTAEYWAGLEGAVSAHFAPVTIRYALPLTTPDHTLTQLFERFANEFATLHEANRVSIELVPTQELAGTPQTWLPTVDAALLSPTEQLIKQGFIHDLSSFAEQDEGFDQGDYYDQASRSVWWQERLWAMPWSMSTNLLYFDKEVFRHYDLPEPTADWTWNELSAVLTQVDIPKNEDSIFVDGSRDTLFALAYSQDRGCIDAACASTLTETGVLAALEWYEQIVVQEQVMADLGNLSPEQRLQAVRRTQSAHKLNAMWVDSVVNYEYQRVLQPTGLLPFPRRSADARLVMPIRVHSHIMSHTTQHPYWTWQWLNFLSHQMPPPRHIPARPSVAAEFDFWQRLPPEIAQMMQIVTANAQPLMIGDESYFTWEKLAGVANGKLTLEEAAKPVETPWFVR